MSMTIEELEAQHLVSDDRAADGHPTMPAEHSVYRRTIGHVELTVSVPRWTPEGPKAVVAVFDRSGRRTLHKGELSLTSLRDKDALVRYLDRAAAARRLSWSVEIGDLFADVCDAERRAALPVLLHDIERPMSDPLIDGGGIPLLRSHPVLLFGDGGTFKSMIGLWVAGSLAKQGVRVLFADWELDGPQHRLRLDGLFGDSPPAVRYLHCEAPILAMAGHLREICISGRIDYLIVDSVAFATGMPAETSEAAMSYFAALRQIGVGGSLSIAHNTKKAPKAELGREKPFGSVFWHNGARMTWLATRQKESDRNLVQLACRKSNLVQNPTPRLVEFTFEPPQIMLAVTSGLPAEQRAQAAEDTPNEKPSKKPSTREQIDGLLRRRGPLSRDQIKRDLPDVRRETLRMALKRGAYTTLEGGGLWNEAKLGNLEDWQKQKRQGRAPEHEHEQES